ncbi:DUF1448-domain-containing protein [Piromyces finnis]|uniref:DUF1448-domain-containing protein n=1 Tax=Piromyces finnis TaxID=1754191 RepID=A0A1Y1VE00_9FUNG|nr:DUF1448-domain-containing protein [Piromyces finnis]|eukprot:ORX53004.1 DUF1448-domain-containing protein [Piromyces finnis]
MSITTSINQIWQDNEICFDISKSALQLYPGEIIFDHFNNIEDIKGSKGESGIITITNLRIIWFSEKNIKRNIIMFLLIFLLSYNIIIFYYILLC